MKRPRRAVTGWTKKDVLVMMVTGLLGHIMAQEAQLLGLDYSLAITTSFLQSFTPVFVVCIGHPIIREAATPVQYWGLAVALAGVLAFFDGQPIGVEAVGVAVVSLGSVARVA